MDMNALLIGMLSMSSVFLVVIIIIFVSRRKRVSAKAELKNSLKATKKKGLSNTAFYQKIYLALATTPIIKRYLFRVRMRLELVRK